MSTRRDLAHHWSIVHHAHQRRVLGDHVVLLGQLDRCRPVRLLQCTPSLQLHVSHLVHHRRKTWTSSKHVENGNRRGVKRRSASRASRATRATRATTAATASQIAQRNRPSYVPARRLGVQKHRCHVVHQLVRWDSRVKRARLSQVQIALHRRLQLVDLDQCAPVHPQVCVAGLLHALCNQLHALLHSIHAHRRQCRRASRCVGNPVAQRHVDIATKTPHKHASSKHL